MAGDGAAREREAAPAGADFPASVDEAITTRHSCRRFLPTPVTREQVEHLLAVARWAPSGTNIQPWQVQVVLGEARARLSRAILAEIERNGPAGQREYDYYPTDWFEPYLARRRACGWGLYGALGITRADKARMAEQHARNYLFFDAPVGLFFTIERRLEVGSWMDLGMFIQNVMVAARGQGLHTCPQAAFANFPAVIRAELGIPDTQVVVCGMAVGYRDPRAPENVWRTGREPVEAFTTWHE